MFFFNLLLYLNLKYPSVLIYFIDIFHYYVFSCINFNLGKIMENSEQSAGEVVDKHDHEVCGFQSTSKHHRKVIVKDILWFQSPDVVKNNPEIRITSSPTNSVIFLSYRTFFHDWSVLELNSGEDITSVDIVCKNFEEFSKFCSAHGFELSIHSQSIRCTHCTRYLL